MSRQDEIMEAALSEFIREGVSGARTQAIADQIGVTKAMIHYYFDTKQNLFRQAFRQAAQTLMDGALQVLEQEQPLFPKIEALIDALLDRCSEHPRLAGFVLNELNQHQEVTLPIFTEICSYDASLFERQLEEAASEYRVAPVKSSQVIANAVSLCIFPYAGGPFLAAVLNRDESAYQQMLQQRREVIKDTIINWMAG